MDGDTTRGFLRDLFDLSFTRFITARVVKVLYVLSIVVLVIAYIAIAVAIFSGGGHARAVTIDSAGQVVGKDTGGGGNTGFGILWLLVLGPLMLLLYTLFYRVLFELLIVIFRIYENVREQTELMRSGAPRAAASSPPAPPAPGGSSSGA